MATAPSDPLLTTARIGTIIVRVALVIGMIGLGIGLAVTTLMSFGYMPEEAMVEIEGMSRNGLWAAGAAMICAIVALGLMYDFVTRLAEIIATVGEGNPFSAANASRLTRMGWLAVAIQVAGLIAALFGKIAERTMGEDVFSLDFSISLSGIGLAVVLFILARVFRTGAAMREELEGTV